MPVPRGKIEAFIEGYMFLEIAGTIVVNNCIILGERAIQITKFSSVDSDFVFEDETVDQSKVEASNFSAVIQQSRVAKTAEGFKTNCILSVV